MKPALLYCAAALLLAGCNLAGLFSGGSCEHVDPAPETFEAGVRSLDAELAALAEAFPGFGGYRVEGSVLVLYLTDPDQFTQAEAIRAALAQLHDSAALARASLVLRTVEYDYGQLLRWKNRSINVLSLSGVSSYGIDETQNRLRIGVSDQRAEACVAENLAVLDVPRRAVILHREEPVEAL